MSAALLKRAALGLAIALLFLAPLELRRYGLFLLSTWAVMTIAAMGLNLTLGYAGQVSLAQGAFVGLGAYCAALLTTAGWPLIAALALALPLGFAVGWLLGFPALRVQGHYLAFITLAFSTMAFLVMRNEAWLTHGVEGVDGVPRPTFFGVSTQGSLAYAYVCLGALVVASLALWAILRSPWGRAFVALRENPIRAQSLGVDVRRYTLTAFAIGSAFGAFSGVMDGPLVGLVEPPAFTLALSLNLLMMTIVGGSGYFFGPFLGAAVGVLLPEALRGWESYYLIAYALMVMAMMIGAPSGLAGVAARIGERVRQRAASAARSRLRAGMERAP